MKRTLCMLLALIMVLSVIFTACESNEPEPTEKPTDAATEATEKATDGKSDDDATGGDDDATGGDDDAAGGDDDAAGDGDDTTPTPGGDDNNTSGGTNVSGDLPKVPDIAGITSVTTTAYTLQKNFLSAAANTMIDDYFNAATKNFGSGYEPSVAPFSTQKDLGLSNTTLTSITIPVLKTKAAVNGNHTFTLYEVKYSSNSESYKNASCILETHIIKIPAVTYGLPTTATDGIRKLIKVDLKPYNIELGAGETLAFFAPDDTLYPMYFTGSDDNESFRNDIGELCSQWQGFYCNVGKTGLMSDNTNALLFDLTYEKTYTSKTEYETAAKAEFTAQNGKMEGTMLSTAQIAAIQKLITEETTAPAYNMPGAPYAPSKDVGLSNTKLNSITIPVRSVNGDGDANGNYIFTLSIVNATAVATTNNAGFVRQVSVLVNKDKYGLAPNTIINKFITVDLSPYNIVLGAGETVAVSKNGDTVIPLYVSGNAPKLQAYCAADPALKNWNEFIMYAGTSCEAERYPTLYIPYNFTFTRTYTSADNYLENDSFNETVTTVTGYENYDAKLEAVKNVYSGKQISILGDSISTYGGISNNGSYNTTLDDVWMNGNKEVTGNAIFYGAGTFGTHLNTYWGRFIAQCNMQLCVSNAWSGSGFGGSGHTFTRAENLHNDNGSTPVNPDLILVYYGINNTPTWANMKTPGDLVSMIASSDNEKATMDEWIDELEMIATLNEYDGGSGSSFGTFAENYAYMMYRMTQKYPNAKIVCVSLATNNYSTYADCVTLVPQYNEIIKIVASYFGCVYVDQTKIMTKENAGEYTTDGIHPNIVGHERLFQAIVNTLYYDLTKDN